MVGVLELSRAECIGELLWNAGGNGWGICSVGNMLAAMCGPVQLIASPILIGTDDAGTRGDEFTDDELRLLVQLSRDRAEKHKEICGDVRLMDLDKFEAADDVNFAHDFMGIRRHIDRETGELRDCFVPRCAK